MSLTGLKRGMVERLMHKKDPAYDSAFPAPVPVGRNALRWRRADVERWQSGRELNALTSNNPRYTVVGFPAPVKTDGVKLWERAAVENWKYPFKILG